MFNFSTIRFETKESEANKIQTKRFLSIIICEVWTRDVCGFRLQELDRHVSKVGKFKIGKTPLFYYPLEQPKPF